MTLPTRFSQQAGPQSYLQQLNNQSNKFVVNSNTKASKFFINLELMHMLDDFAKLVEKREYFTHYSSDQIPSIVEMAKTEKQNWLQIVDRLTSFIDEGVKSLEDHQQKNSNPKLTKDMLGPDSLIENSPNSNHHQNDFSSGDDDITKQIKVENFSLNCGSKEVNKISKKKSTGSIRKANIYTMASKVRQYVKNINDKFPHNNDNNRIHTKYMDKGHIQQTYNNINKGLY